MFVLRNIKSKWLSEIVWGNIDAETSYIDGNNKQKFCISVILICYFNQLMNAMQFMLSKYFGLSFMNPQPIYTFGNMNRIIQENKTAMK